MSTAIIEITKQLQALGYIVQEPASGFVSFQYKIPVGRFREQIVDLAFQIDGAFPMNPVAGGPHFKPHLLPITGGGGSHPFGAVHNSPLGGQWQYWSRPFREWNQSDKTVKTYMAHIRHLLDTIP